MTQRVTILDGGMGRQLQAMGAPFKRPEWSALALMEAPEFVTAAHDAYIEAGADIITTNSYALVPFHIGQERFDMDGRALMKSAAEIARACANKAPRNIQVAGCLPPAFGSYRPDYFSADKAAKIYQPLIEEQEPFVDFWLAETLSSTIELETLAPLLNNSTKDFWASFTLRDRQGEDIPPQLRSTESLTKAVEVALSCGVDALLFNCSQVEEMSAALRHIQKMELDIPYGVYANAFEPVKTDIEVDSQVIKTRSDTTPEVYLNHAREWQALGASIIGGCCGIGPEHIKALPSLNGK